MKINRLKKNDIITLKIQDMTSDGTGVGKHDGMAIFVPKTAIGDEILARILKPTKSFAYAKIEHLVLPSTDRIESDCPYFSKCGGCSYRHITYEAELKIKSKKVTDALERIGHFDSLKLEQILAAPSRNGYRNKALLPLKLEKARQVIETKIDKPDTADEKAVAHNLPADIKALPFSPPEDKLIMGYYTSGSHRIVDCEACLLHPVEFNSAMSIFRTWYQNHPHSVYDETSHKGNLRRFYLRKSEQSNSLMACIVTKESDCPDVDILIKALSDANIGLKSFVINQNPEITNVALGKDCKIIFGNETIEDTLCNLTFHISPLSFYQVNHYQAERLYELVRSYVSPTKSDILLDLYCGTGTIGLSMANSVKKLVGIDIIPEAIADAKQNALQNQIDNATFLCGDTALITGDAFSSDIKPDTVIVDPPRKGCTVDTIALISSLSPAKIVYVSCDPATLARDLKRFSELGYSPTKAQSVDMFPATSHVETIVLMSRVDK